MSRLFITNKEISWTQDTIKELIKDVIGQKIYYYPISTLKTQVHPVYEEAVYKIFENPIKVDAIISQPDWKTSHTNFGPERSVTFEVFVQARDLIDKQITISEGDYFTYGDNVFEIQSYINTGNLFGQVEYENGYKIMGKMARPGTFDPKFFLGPTTDGKDFATSGAQQTFVQQRGLPETIEGATGDYRQERERLNSEGDEMVPVGLGDGPRVVGPDPQGKGQKIYDE